MQLAIYILLTITATPAWAGDAATLNFIGFSDTGKYLAFQQYGVTDGKGAAYATLYFLDVLDNRYQDKPIETIEDYKSGAPAGREAQETVRQLNLEQAKTQLKTLDISAGNTGMQVVSHSPHDTDVDSHIARFSLDSKSNIKYEINLEERQLKPEADCGSHPIDTTGFTLLLKQGDNGKPKVLQHDSKVPKSRGCPQNYHIQDVYVYKNKYVAVFIHVYTASFEGKNMRYIVVTGTLD